MEQACDDANLKQALIVIYFVGLAILIANGLWWFVYTLSRYKPVTSRIPAARERERQIRQILLILDTAST
jgi:hypothetical protein